MNDDALTTFANEPRLITEPGRAARVAALAEPVLAGLDDEPRLVGKGRGRVVHARYGLEFLQHASCK